MSFETQTQKVLDDLIKEVTPKSADDVPAMDDEATANLVTMFKSLCVLSQLEPKEALAVLGAQDWGDDTLLGARFRQGF